MPAALHNPLSMHGLGQRMQQERHQHRKRQQSNGEVRGAQGAVMLIASGWRLRPTWVMPTNTSTGNAPSTGRRSIASLLMRQTKANLAVRSNY